MTRTSSDDAHRDGFARRYAVLVVVLMLACAGLVAANFVVGPRLASATVDTSLVTTRAEQQLRLFSTEAVASVSAAQVSVTPRVPVSVSVSGRAIAVQFAQPLDYATSYSVTVAGVHNAFDGQRSTFRYRFTTADAVVYSLSRTAGGDSIVRSALHSADRSTVYSAPRISSFARCGSLLLVATLDSGESTLTLIDPASGKTEPVELPEAGLVDDLRASDAGTAAGFTFTSTAGGLTPDYDQALFQVDLSGAGGGAIPVAGLDGSQLRVTDWDYLPGTATVAVRTVAGDVSVVDPADPAALQPLGSFSEFHGISTDGTRLAVGDQLGPIDLTIADRSQSRITPSKLDGVEPYGGDVALMRGGVRVQAVSVPDAATATFTTSVVRDDGTTSTPIFRMPGADGRVLSLSVSANDQLLLVEVDPNASTSTSDRYEVDAAPTSVETAIVDIATGALVKSFVGLDASL